jgi:hypothetical protein
MKRDRKSWNNENTQEFYKDEHYNFAYKKVKRIKGFYSHLKAYFIVNLLIIMSSLNRNFIGSHFDKSGLFEWHNYATAFYWGIALFIHWFIVFGRDLFFSSEWEERKIQEYMENEKSDQKE